MKVLFVSNYVDPKKNYNQNVVEQVKYFKKNLKINSEILTWPTDNNWSYQIPIYKNGYLKKSLNNITYHLYNFDKKWNTDFNILDEIDWNDAIKFGEKVLKVINPDIVHLHHRHSMWWILESAQNIKIPTIYTNHDWGIPCMQTNLLMGNGKLCNGMTGISKCSNCVKQGRGTLGMINEKFVEIKILSFSLKFLYKLFPSIFTKYKILRANSNDRSQIHIKRAKKILNNLTYMITPSNFGKSLFEKFITNTKKILVMPWPLIHKDKYLFKKKQNKKKIIFTYIGRIEKTKGIENFIIALFQTELSNIIIRIVGKDDSKYCKHLIKKYISNDSISIEWYKWQKTSKFYENTNYLVIPSIWMDNTPLTLIEALSFNIPVLASNIPTISDYVKNKELLFKPNDINDIKAKIKLSIDKIDNFSKSFQKTNFSMDMYCKNIKDIYLNIYASK